MKKLMYLFVISIMLFFISCGGENSADTSAGEVVVACGDDCQKACCLGCKATQGAIKCIVLPDGSMPCCIPGEM